MDLLLASLEELGHEQSVDEELTRREQVMPMGPATLPLRLLRVITINNGL